MCVMATQKPQGLWYVLRPQLPQWLPLGGLPLHGALLLDPTHFLMVPMFSLRHVLIEILKLSNQKWGKAAWEFLSCDTAKDVTVSAQAA